MLIKKPTNETFTTHGGITVNVSPGVAELNTLKKVNEVQRIVQRNSSIYTKDLVSSLIEKIRMLQKQKKFLQTKLREACNGTKSSNN